MKKIHLKQNINLKLTKVKKQVQSTVMIQAFIEYSNDMQDVLKH